jgi:hypothetical protein
MEFVDLAAVEEELAYALRRGNLVARALIRLDVGAVEKGFAFFDPGEGVADIGFAGADRFDLAALQFDASLVALEDVKIAERLAIENGLSGHGRRGPARETQLRLGGRVFELLVGELAGDDFL